MTKLFNFAAIKKATALDKPAFRYDVCYQYWTLVQTSNRPLAHIIWWWFKTFFKIGGGCVLVRFCNGHYMNTIRPKEKQNN